MNKIEIIINSKCWLESTAKEQLIALADLEGIEKVVGLPDLHAGLIPIGVAVKTKGIIYPHIIGGDIGCGMQLIKTGVQKRKFKIDKAVKALEKIKSLDNIKIDNPYDEKSPIYNLGTVGLGNHFAEFQILDKVYNKEEFEKLNLEKDDMLLLVHSGSRGLGERILNNFNLKKA